MKQKFKYLISFLCGAIFFSGVSYAAESTQLIAKVANYKIVVNGKEKQLKNKPVIINNSTYVPLRELGEIVGAKVGFSNGVINLESNQSISNTGGNTSEGGQQYNFQKLPVTKELDGISVTVNSVEITEGSTNFHLTIRNNTSDKILVRFDDTLLGYNYNVPGKKYGTTGTINTRDFPTVIDANSEVSGIVKKGPVDPDAENLIFHITFNNDHNKALTFHILLK